MMGKLNVLGSIGKAQAAIERIATFKEEGVKLVVVIKFLQTQQAIAEAYPEALTIFGGMNANAKQAVIERFETDPTADLLLLSLLAGKEGIDGLQRQCSNMLVVDEDWVPGNMDQVYGRLDRDGQQESVSVWTLLAENTIDEKVNEALHDKRIVVGEVLDGKAVVVDETQVAASALKDVLARANAKRAKTRKMVS
jgi:SNF2 family DNA or RNA helicase